MSAPAALAPRRDIGAALVLRVLGVLLLVPAIAFWIRDLVDPSLDTWRLSKKHESLNGQIHHGGPSNYSGLHLGKPLNYALSLGLLPLLLALIVGPLIGVLAAYADRPLRLVTRAVVGLLFFLFAPVGMAFAYLVSHGHSGPGSVRSATFFAAFALVCSVSVAVYLGVFRPRPHRARAWPTGVTAVVVAFVVAATVLAVSAQIFTLPQLLTGGGPANRSSPPLLLMFKDGLTQFDPGRGAAIATLTLLLVGGLGLIAGLIILAFQLRCEVGESERPAGQVSSAMGALAVIAAVVLMIVGIVLLRHWLGGLHHTSTKNAPDDSRVFANTWLVPLTPTIVATLAAAVGGFGIGALRPLGRASEWLLLPFAPWLFVGLGPFMLTRYLDLSHAKQLNTHTALEPKLWISIPALFAFTLLFAAIRRRWDARRAAGQPPSVAFAVPSLVATAVLVAVATWIMHAQSLLGPLAFNQDPHHFTAPVYLAGAVAVQLSNAGPVPYGLANPIALVVLLALVGAAGHVLLDTLSIRSGPKDKPTPLATDPVQ